MSLNAYKIRTFKHFEKMLNLHYYKPIVAIFIKDEIEKDKKNYKNLKDTIRELSNVNVYVLILLINTNNIEEFKELRNNNYIQMYYKSNQCLENPEVMTNDNINLIITSKISEWNRKFIEDILVNKKETVKNNIDKIVEKINVNDNDVKDTKSINISIHEENASNSSESINSSILLEINKIEKIQQELNNLI
jgi:hypothetical protein